MSPGDVTLIRRQARAGPPEQPAAPQAGPRRQRAFEVAGGGLERAGRHRTTPSPWASPVARPHTRDLGVKRRPAGWPGRPRPAQACLSMKQRPTRRRFLQGAAAAAGGALLLRGQRSDAGLLDLLPLPELSGIQHIVVVMMENRSFDHLLGWL